MIDFIYSDTLSMFLAVFMMGSAVGFAELAQRYTDGFVDIFRFSSAYLYLFINGLFSCLTLALMTHYDYYLGGVPDDDFGKVMIAGLSAIFFLRSSAFAIKVNDKDYPVGLAAIANIFLDKVDKAFDQQRATHWVPKVERIMRDVDFSRASGALPTLCLSLMQNMSKEEQETLRKEVESLSRGDFDENPTKSIILGVTITKYTGFRVLERAVNSIKESISIRAASRRENEGEPLDELNVRATKIINKLRNS